MKILNDIDIDMNEKKNNKFIKMYLLSMDITTI